MMFSCLQENLEKGLNIVSKAIPTKSALPILSNVLITTENGRLKLSATNLETTISTYVGASIDKEGEITIPAKTFKDFIANLSPSTVNANVLNETMHLSSERTKSKFNGTNPTEYPELPRFKDDAEMLELDAKEFIHAINNVAFAASTDDSRPIFTGIYLNHKDSVLTIAASDGFRLSEKTLTTKGTLGEFTIIIPAKTVLEISRIFSGTTEPIKFAISKSENLAIFQGEDTLVATRLLDGNYPDYKRIIPSNIVVSADFLTQDLLEAVRLTNVFAKELSNVVKLKISAEGGIKVVSTAQEAGEHLSEIPAEIDGTDMELAFNSKYLLDFLNNTKTDKISMRASGNLSPCLFRPQSEETFLHIVMPMQTQ